MKNALRALLALSLLWISCISFGQAPQFRFAWLTDTHIGSANAAADLEASVRDINGMPGIAFVLLSGDITEIGSDEQFAQAKAILDTLQKPYHILPGNHDTKWSESGCTTFRRLFKDDRFMFEYGGYRFIGLHQGPIMKMGDGHFASEDVRWLDSVLSGIPDRNQPLIFVTHYPLDNSIDNWFTVIDRLKRCNTQAVLVGHGHQNRSLDFEGLPGVMGRSNLRAKETAGGFTVVEMQPEAMRFFLHTPGSTAETQWHGIALLKHDYSGTAAANPRPDYSVNSTYPRVKPLWSVDTGYTIASTPAVWKDRLVIGDASGTVHCLALKSGKEEWRFTTGSSVYATPGTAGGKAVFGSTDQHVYCLDMKSGRLLWKVPTGAAVVGGAAISNGIAYIGGSDRVFRALDLDTGKVRWEFKGLEGFVETRPLIAGDKVIFGAWDTFLYALNAADGTLAWKWSNGSRALLYSPAACWPVAAAGRVFIAAPDRYLTAIDAASGTPVWRTNQFAVREMIGISQNRARIYARCTTDTVVALSTTASNPEVLWSANCGYGYDIDPSMPVEKDGTVFFGTKNGMVYALDARTGAVRWKYRMGVTVVNTPVAINSRQALVTDLDGRVTLIGMR